MGLSATALVVALVAPSTVMGQSITLHRCGIDDSSCLSNVQVAVPIAVSLASQKASIEPSASSDQSNSTKQSADNSNKALAVDLLNQAQKNILSGGDQSNELSNKQSVDSSATVSTKGGETSAIGPNADVTFKLSQESDASITGDAIAKSDTGNAGNTATAKGNIDANGGDANGSSSAEGGNGNGNAKATDVAAQLESGNGLASTDASAGDGGNAKANSGDATGSGGGGGGGGGASTGHNGNDATAASIAASIAAALDDGDASSDSASSGPASNGAGSGAGTGGAGGAGGAGSATSGNPSSTGGAGGAASSNSSSTNSDRDQHFWCRERDQQWLQWQRHVRWTRRKRQWRQQQRQRRWRQWYERLGHEHDSCGDYRRQLTEHPGCQLQPDGQCDCHRRSRQQYGFRDVDAIDERITVWGEQPANYQHADPDGHDGWEQPDPGCQFAPDREERKRRGQ